MPPSEISPLAELTFTLAEFCSSCGGGGKDGKAPLSTEEVSRKLALFLEGQLEGGEANMGLVEDWDRLKKLPAKRETFVRSVLWPELVRLVSDLDIQSFSISELHTFISEPGLCGACIKDIPVSSLEVLADCCGKVEAEDHVSGVELKSESKGAAPLEARNLTSLSPPEVSFASEAFSKSRVSRLEVEDVLRLGPTVIIYNELVRMVIAPVLCDGLMANFDMEHYFERQIEQTQIESCLLPPKLALDLATEEARGLASLSGVVTLRAFIAALANILDLHFVQKKEGRWEVEGRKEGRSYEDNLLREIKNQFTI